MCGQKAEWRPVSYGENDHMAFKTVDGNAVPTHVIACDKIMGRICKICSEVNNKHSLVGSGFVLGVKN